MTRSQYHGRTVSSVGGRMHRAVATAPIYTNSVYQLLANRNREQIREFCQFLAHEWRGSRQHSYTVPSRGKSRGWSRTVNGKWSAVGLADAVSKYTWSGKNFSESKAELDRFAADLQAAIQQGSNNDV